ncbi:MAG: cadmium-translocating P-type ATPase [Candidatus Doudnabacteria bacterium]|nr:cadmium-translocating P-type ATPase [Candidatus Doudnabacteria bacterium]
MHPEIRRDKPGLCPECGMALVPSRTKRGLDAESRGLDKHAGHSTRMFLRKFWVSLILTIPIVYLHFGEFPNSGYIALLLGSVVFFYGGWVFLAGAGRELRAKLPGMMTLIGLAISAAYVWSVYAVFAGAEPLFWELATLITVMLLGHFLEMRAVSGAQGALKELSKLLPDVAEVIRDGQTEKIPLSELQESDIVLVRPGAKVPADGQITEGDSDVNESMVTGESKPVPKKAGNEVIAGTINGDGSLKIKVTKIGEHTFLAGVMRLVAEAQASKSRLQILSDRAALYLTVIAVAGGIITLAAWLIAGREVSFAVARLVAVLVIACPHALGLAVPLVASISTTKAAQNGFLVKQRLALEAARTIDTVLFDKTGTLTEGAFGVEEIITPHPSSPTRGEELKERGRILQLAASVNQHSEHPIGKAIVAEARRQSLELLPAKDFQRIPGKGAQAVIGGKMVVVGSETILPSDVAATFRSPVSEGKTIIYVIVAGELAGSIALADVIREESREAVKALKGLGVRPAMITGDSKDVAEWVSGELGIDEYFARVLPSEKAEKVKALQKRGRKVAMVGDGVNDAPALMQADLGIAIGAGTNVAIESAGIILVRNDPRDIMKIVKLSRLTYTKMIQNLFWATGYNVIALPLAAGVLAAKGILLEPALAAVFMSASTVIVAVNAVFLRRRGL